MPRNPYLCEFPLGEDVVVSLPDPLDGQSGSKETVSDAKNSKYDDKDNDQSEAGFHGCRKTIQNSPSVTTVLAASHARIITINGGAV